MKSFKAIICVLFFMILQMVYATGSSPEERVALLPTGAFALPSYTLFYCSDDLQPLEIMKKIRVALVKHGVCIEKFVPTVGGAHLFWGQERNSSFDIHGNLYIDYKRISFYVTLFRNLEDPRLGRYCLHFHRTYGDASDWTSLYRKVLLNCSDTLSEASKAKLSTVSRRRRTSFRLSLLLPLQGGPIPCLHFHRDCLPFYQMATSGLLKPRLVAFPFLACGTRDPRIALMHLCLSSAHHASSRASDPHDLLMILERFISSAHTSFDATADSSVCDAASGESGVSLSRVTVASSIPRAHPEVLFSVMGLLANLAENTVLCASLFSETARVHFMFGKASPQTNTLVLRALGSRNLFGSMSFRICRFLISDLTPRTHLDFSHLKQVLSKDPSLLVRQKARLVRFVPFVESVLADSTTRDPLRREASRTLHFLKCLQVELDSV